MQFSLFLLVYTWNDCEKWTNANTHHLMQTHQLCTRQVICHSVQHLHVYSGYLVSRMLTFTIKLPWVILVSSLEVQLWHEDNWVLQTEEEPGLQGGATQWNVAQRLNASLAGSYKGFRAQDALIIGDVPGDFDLPPNEKTSTSQTWYYVNTKSLPDRSMTSWGLLRVPLWPLRPAVRPPLLQQHRQPDETGVHVMFGRNVLNGLWYSSLMSPGSPCSSMTAKNVCTDVQESDLLTSVSQGLLFAGGSIMVWGAFSFHDWTPLNVIDGNLTRDH